MSLAEDTEDQRWTEDELSNFMKMDHFFLLDLLDLLFVHQCLYRWYFWIPKVNSSSTCPSQDYRRSIRFE